MTIPFTQFMRPHGLRRKVLIESRPDIEQLASELLGAGYGFEIEELMSGLVSMEVCRGEHEILADSLVPNGPRVVEAVEDLIKVAHRKYMRVNDHH